MWRIRYFSCLNHYEVHIVIMKYKCHFHIHKFVINGNRVNTCIFQIIEYCINNKKTPYLISFAENGLSLERLNFSSTSFPNEILVFSREGAKVSQWEAAVAPAPFPSGAVPGDFVTIGQRRSRTIF